MGSSVSGGREGSLRVLFLVSAHNSLSQRAWIALTELGHEVTVAVVDSAAAMEAAVGEHRPQLIVCPILKKLIPESIWATHRCLIVHPGPRGDRGPSSLDWAIELGMREWGVTVLEANGDLDAGDVWATRTFPTRAVGKSSLYRHEVRRAAIEALVEAMGRIAAGAGAPDAAESSEPAVTGRARPLMSQERPRDRLALRHHRHAWSARSAPPRAIRACSTRSRAPSSTSSASTASARCAAARGRSSPSATARSAGRPSTAPSGSRTSSAATRRTERFFKLPATRALALACPHFDAPEIPVAIDAPLPPGYTFREIAYEERAGVGYLHFDFYNGAMSTDQCRRLHEAYLFARSRRQTKVIALMGGSDFFSNGIHLNVIEAADDPAAESWSNLRAIDDVVREIIETDSHLVLSALGGDAAAGGVPFALAADQVVAREDVVLNPYYRHMGGLYGSEYWTYLLPRRVGAELTARLTGPPFTSVGTRQAVEMGLLDAAFGTTLGSFRSQVRDLAERLAGDPDVDRRLEGKRRRRARDEEIKPLNAYRTEELARSYRCFFGEDRSYHEARHRFVHKLGAPCAVGPSDALMRAARRAA